MAAEVLYDEWNKLFDWLEHTVPKHIAAWCFYPKVTELYGDLTVYTETIKPNQHCNGLEIKKRLKSKKFSRNIEVLAMVNTMLENQNRFWYDPEPPTQNKQKWQPRRPMVECIAKIHDYIANRPLLLAALQAEGQQFTAWYRMFPGAAYIAAKIEQWYWENYKHTYWFWNRDGWYRGDDEEDPWSDPEDYLQYVASPRYLCNVLENVYCGRYGSAEEVAEDMRLVFSNARAYYGEDAEFGTSKYCKATEASFEKEWAVWSVEAPKSRPEDYIPRCPPPAGAHGAVVGGPTGVGAGRGAAAIQAPSSRSALAPSSRAGSVSSASASGSAAVGAAAGAGAGSTVAGVAAAMPGTVNQQLSVLVNYMTHLQSGGDISSLPLKPQKFHDWAAALQPQIQQLLQMQAQLKGGAGAAAEAAGQAESAGQETTTAT